MKCAVVAGARPNFMKVAPILRALDEQGHLTSLVHTGQHYDPQMSSSFFRQLSIREPDYSLEVGSGSHARQTALVMLRFEPVILGFRPDWIIVVGDVNSTLACSLVAAKLRTETGSRIAHVEAGLRSCDWDMPEEINRVLTDRLADILFTSSPEGATNLQTEGISRERVFFVGNVMVDTLLHELARARAAKMARKLGLGANGYLLATVHRPSNVDEPARLQQILSALGKIASRVPVVFPVHPRTRARMCAFGLEPLLEPLVAVDPLGYHEMISLMDDASVVLTDSGGIQEETTVLGIPCVTVRENTERPITVERGTNRLVPWPPTTSAIISAVEAAEEAGRRTVNIGLEGWDGKAAQRIVEILATEHAGHQTNH